MRPPTPTLLLLCIGAGLSAYGAHSWLHARPSVRVQHRATISRLSRPRPALLPPAPGGYRDGTQEFIVSTLIAVALIADVLPRHRHCVEPALDREVAGANTGSSDKRPSQLMPLASNCDRADRRE